MSHSVFQPTALPPIYFFRLDVEVSHGQVVGAPLPVTSPLLGEEQFADVSLAWHESGITARVDVHQPLEGAVYPKYQEGDAIELWFDTRDLKGVGLPTKFCHHFLVLPTTIQGVQAVEITRLRAEENRPLCNPAAIEVTTEIASKSYTTTIFFPADILHGYDPSSFGRLGFTYCIHRPKGGAQHFALSSHYVAVAGHPSLWATCRLVR